jgi:membrane-associated protein
MEFFDPIIQISTDPLVFFQFFGYWGLATILFAETGLFGFFLPGDSLLITLGLLSSQDYIDLRILIPSLILATILGDHLSYFLGRKFDGWVRRNMHRIFLDESHIENILDELLNDGFKTTAIFIERLETLKSLRSKWEEGDVIQVLTI